MKAYVTETGLFEYTDKQGYKRIGQWEQKYVGYRSFYDKNGPLTDKQPFGEIEYYADEDSDDYVNSKPDNRPDCKRCLKYELHSKLNLRRVKNKLVLQCDQCGYSRRKKFEK
jgi:hypothetical protein